MTLWLSNITAFLGSSLGKCLEQLRFPSSTVPLVGPPEPQGSSSGSLLSHFLNTKLQQALSKCTLSFLNILVQFFQMSKSHAIIWHHLVNPLTFLASFFFFKDSSQTFDFIPCSLVVFENHVYSFVLILG